MACKRQRFWTVVCHLESALMILKVLTHIDEVSYIIVFACRVIQEQIPLVNSRRLLLYSINSLISVCLELLTKDKCMCTFLHSFQLLTAIY